MIPCQQLKFLELKIEKLTLERDAAKRLADDRLLAWQHKCGVKSRRIRALGKENRRLDSEIRQLKKEVRKT